MAFWDAFNCVNTARETHGRDLEELQTQVSDCLSRDPMDLKKAERLTALASFLMSGQRLN